MWKQNEFFFTFGTKVVEIGCVAFLCDTDINGCPYLPDDALELWYDEVFNDD